jgi:hypothetical protein
MSERSPEPPKGSGPDDLVILCGMFACLSGAGAFGGCLGTALGLHLKGADFMLAAVFGILVGSIVTWAAWHLGRRIFLFWLRRKARSNTVEWKAVAPMAIAIGVTFFGLSGYLGSLLSEYFVEHFVR